MDGEHVKTWEARCIEEQPPACTAACPLHVDGRAMLGKLATGDFSAAFALYARMVPFPAIISHICDHPCETACRRAELGGSLRIRALERALVEESYATLRRSAQRNRKPKRVAVIGGGLAGLTAAFDLAMKGHAITVFESEGRLLDRLHTDYDDSLLPASAIAADLGQLASLGVDVRLLSRVVAGDGPLGLDFLIDSFDALLLALGRGPRPHLGGSLDLDADSHVVVDAASGATSHPKVFAALVHDRPTAGGEHPPYSPVGSMYDGRRAAVSVDRFLQGVSLVAGRSDAGAAASCLYVNLDRHAPEPAVVPRDGAAGYTPDEAMAEAGRCLPCECKECVRACEYLKHYGGYPKRYIREIYNNDGIVMGNRKSNRMIDSCTLCGQCGEICPNDLAMGDVCLEARQSMVRQGKMPPSHHDFALADMEVSRSAAAAIARHAPGTTASAYLFFPGCQLTASSPAAVEAIYAHLRQRLPGGVGLFVDCCGAPAQWSGRVDMHAAILDRLRDSWRDLGSPVVITACSSCLKGFEAALPEFQTRSLWTVLADVGLPDGARAALPGPFALHDPCSGRKHGDVQRAVRDLAGRLGAEVRELPGGADLTPCCGFGGLAEFVNPEVTDKIVVRRAGEDAADYLTYCAMCRDNFARAGKRALHLLDLVFPAGDDPAGRRDPGFSGRRTNRLRFKIDMMRKLWGIDMDEPQVGLELVIADDVRADMERKLILVPDVEAVIASSEASGEHVEDGVTGHRIASYRTGHFTCWVEYEPAGSAYIVHRAYGHRMQVRVLP